MLKIKLRLKKDKKIENRVFTVSFISGRMLRRTLEMTEKINFENISVDELDELIDYVVEVFDDQFTRDEVYDGLDSKDIIEKIRICISAVINGVEEAIDGNHDESDTEKN